MFDKAIQYTYNYNDCKYSNCLKQYRLRKDVGLWNLDRVFAGILVKLKIQYLHLRISAIEKRLDLLSDAVEGVSYD